MRRLACGIAASVVLGGCALKGDVRRVEDQLTEYREQTARADSARAVMLARLLDELSRLHVAANKILDSLQAQRLALFSMQGSFRGEITEVQRQLVAIQELTGQSQARLTDLRNQLENRILTASAGEPTPPAQGGGDAPEEDSAGPEEIFQMGMQQLRRGSPRTARVAFRRILEEFPEHGRAADALYWVGESFRTEAPDSAVAAFEEVVERFPSSVRAPLALYKIGLDAERRGDSSAARLAFQRVVAGYPRSDEADLARAKLSNP